ncbi:oligosaccharide flippase family protein [Shewanella surugensis]|uniref:Oligosaccharide flippase family protein n=1 Tax=Shewanella surugensis TaxID=212020 RepID=A0ABT0LB22_9GAMM|nr:oligosaccharide flippase family protein [Shewanella surugensis]MCL1124906.1 oligosaccharide flippase family protein [Shewanella surugensis]
MPKFFKWPISFQSRSHNILGKSLFWLGSAQIMGRVVRLMSSIIIARLLTPENFGQIAIILTSFELICTPLRRLTTAALIKLSETDFIKALPNANKINWASSITAFLVMSLLSFLLAYYYQSNHFILPMLLMAISYLILPFGMLHVALNLRQNRMRIVGRAVLWQTVIDGLLTTILALIGLGIWAIIIPKVIVTFVWLWIHRYQNPLPSQTPIHTPNLSPALPVTHKTEQKTAYSTKAILKFGIPVGLSDITLAFRQNVDYLLVGYFLGVEALGIYFFAFNASLGISLGIIQSYGTALYSHLCQPSQETLQQKFRLSLKFIMMLTVPIIVLQTSLAPWYLPLVYGEKWLTAGALPIFIMLCLSGLVRPLGEAVSQFLLSNNQAPLNLKANIVLTLLLVVCISVASLWGLQAIALASLICYFITLPSFTYFLIRQQDKKISKMGKELPNDA